MYGLVYNEIAKIFAQRRFIVILILLTILDVLGALITRAVAHQMGLDMTASQYISRDVTESAQLLYPFLVAVLMADTIAGELTSGTLKLLVIRPVSRWKIWLSKLVAGYLASVVMVLYAVVCAYVALGATVGFGSWSAPETLSGITATSGMVMLHVSALEMASLFSVVSILMLISTFIDSGTVAGLISGALVVICTIAGGIIKLVVNLLPKTRWMEYAFFMHWQIAGHANGNFPLDNWSTMGSLAVLAAWSVLCIILSIIYFQGKDIKG